MLTKLNRTKGKFRKPKKRRKLAEWERTKRERRRYNK